MRGKSSCRPFFLTVGDGEDHCGGDGADGNDDGDDGEDAAVMVSTMMIS